MIQMIFPYLLIALGIFISALSLSKFHQATVGRLQKERILPKLKIKPEKIEVMRGGGVNLSRLTVGMILILFGIILSLKS